MVGSNHGAGQLILLITPTDRHGDAKRLAQSALRVIATSRAESSIRQIMDASPAAIAVELIPSLAEETLRFIAQLALASRLRRIPLFVYGAPASAADLLEVARLGAEWVPLTAPDRPELASALHRTLADTRNVMVS